MTSLRSTDPLAVLREGERVTVSTPRVELGRAPPEFSGNCLFWTVPDIPDFPPEARNRGVVVIVGVHSGSLEEGAAFVQPLRELAEPLVDLSGQMPFSVI